MKKMRRLIAVLMVLLIAGACNKSEKKHDSGQIKIARESRIELSGGKEYVANVPLRVGETDIMLPIGTKLVIPEDAHEVQVQLPAGYTFLANGAEGKTLPVPFSTYTCMCSRDGSFCKVFFAEGLGFGCLQYSCAGSCTGKFTYMGYSVDRVIATDDKETFFMDAGVQAYIRSQIPFALLSGLSNEKTDGMVYLKQEVAGVSYYLLVDATRIPVEMKDAIVLPPRALCECEGTKACILRTVSLRTANPLETSIDIHFCDGRCNMCELTVD